MPSVIATTRAMRSLLIDATYPRAGENPRTHRRLRASRKGVGDMRATTPPPPPPSWRHALPFQHGGSTDFTVSFESPDEEGWIVARIVGIPAP
jgi:hypothetical protein